MPKRAAHVNARMRPMVREKNEPASSAKLPRALPLRAGPPGNSVARIK